MRVKEREGSGRGKQMKGREEGERRLVKFVDGHAQKA